MTTPAKRVRQPAITLDLRQAQLDHGPQTPVRIVLHDTESPDQGLAGMRGIVGYWQHSTPGYGAHLIIDKDGETARVVDDHHVAWHTGGNNTGSLGIEQVGYGRFTRAQWFKRPKQLMQVARWLAYWSKTYGIPLELSIRAGVSTHAMNSAVFPASEGHTDPGPNYPLRFVLALARTLKRFGW